MSAEKIMEKYEKKIEKLVTKYEKILEKAEAKWASSLVKTEAKARKEFADQLVKEFGSIGVTISSKELAKLVKAAVKKPF